MTNNFNLKHSKIFNKVHKKFTSVTKKRIKNLISKDMFPKNYSFKNKIASNEVKMGTVKLRAVTSDNVVNVKP